MLSDLPFFKEGLTPSAPGARIDRYWDSLDNLLPPTKEGRVASDIAVTVRFEDLNLDYGTMMDLVDVVRRISEKGIGNKGPGAQLRLNGFAASIQVVNHRGCLRAYAWRGGVYCKPCRENRSF